MPVVTPERPKLKSVVLLMGVLLVFSVCLLIFILFFPGIIGIFEPEITHKYDDRYATDGALVYYWDNGYKKVDGADTATFRSLRDKNTEGRHRVVGHVGCVAGRDNNAVFIGRIRIETLNPEKTRVLFGRYITDGTLVYYRDAKPIPNADPATLDHIIGHYARDRNALYYKAAEMRDADLPSLNYITEKPLQGGPGIAADLTGAFRSLDSSRKDGDYLKDERNVYFRGVSVPGADPASFRVLYVEGDQWRLSYAEDKNGYYFKGRPLPSTVAGTGEKLEPGSLKLLQADRNFGWPELFYANASVYAFNTQEEKLEHVFTRKTSAPFTRITRGVYADDRNVFFSACHDIWGRTKNGGRVLKGRSAYLQPLQDVSPEDFVKIGRVDGPPSRREGEIFEANGIRYFHPRFVDRGAALTYLEPDGSGLSPEDWEDCCSRPRRGVIMEPLGLKRIPLQEEFAHTTDLRSFIRRNLSLVLLVSLVIMFAGGYIADRAAKARVRKLRKKLIPFSRMR